MQSRESEAGRALLQWKIEQHKRSSNSCSINPRHSRDLLVGYDTSCTDNTTFSFGLHHCVGTVDVAVHNTV